MAFKARLINLKRCNIAQDTASGWVLNRDNLILYILFELQEAGTFEFIRSIGRIDRFETGDPELAPTVQGGIFRELTGNHSRITFDIDLTAGCADHRSIEKRVRLGFVTLDQEETVVVRHPLSRQQHISVEHPGLLPGLTVDQIMLFVGGVEEKETVGEQQYGTDGNDEFSYNFHDTSSPC